MEPQTSAQRALITGEPIMETGWGWLRPGRRGEWRDRDALDRVRLMSHPDGEGETLWSIALFWKGTPQRSRRLHVTSNEVEARDRASRLAADLGLTLEVISEESRKAAGHVPQPTSVSLTGAGVRVNREGSRLFLRALYDREISLMLLSFLFRALLGWMLYAVGIGALPIEPFWWSALTDGRPPGELPANQQQFVERVASFYRMGVVLALGALFLSSTLGALHRALFGRQKPLILDLAADGLLFGRRSIGMLSSIAALRVERDFDGSDPVYALLMLPHENRYRPEVVAREAWEAALRRIVWRSLLTTAAVAALALTLYAHRGHSLTPDCLVGPSLKLGIANALLLGLLARGMERLHQFRRHRREGEWDRLAAQGRPFRAAGFASPNDAAATAAEVGRFLGVPVQRAGYE